MTRRNINDILGDFSNELVVIKRYRKQIGHPEKNLKPEVRRLEKLTKEIRIVVKHLRSISKQYE
jgi:hypothetical protein